MVVGFTETYTTMIGNTKYWISMECCWLVYPVNIKQTLKRILYCPAYSAYSVYWWLYWWLLPTSFVETLEAPTKRLVSAKVANPAILRRQLCLCDAKSLLKLLVNPYQEGINSYSAQEVINSKGNIIGISHPVEIAYLIPTHAYIKQHIPNIGYLFLYVN